VSFVHSILFPCQVATSLINDCILYNTQFNSGTYTGVTLYALSLWGYMPQGSTIAKHAKDIIAKTWTSIGMYYNPTLHTLGGPWDRAYGYNMVFNLLARIPPDSMITACLLWHSRGADVRRVFRG
jgi:hypothetical protein